NTDEHSDPLPLAAAVPRPRELRRRRVLHGSQRRGCVRRRHRGVGLQAVQWLPGRQTVRAEPVDPEGHRELVDRVLAGAGRAHAPVAEQHRGARRATDDLRRRRIDEAPRYAAGAGCRGCDTTYTTPSHTASAPKINATVSGRGRSHATRMTAASAAPAHASP